MSAEVLQDREGTRTIQVSHRDGLAIMHFEKPVRWCALDPETARAFAEAMSRAAYAAFSGDTPTTQDRSAVTEQIRVRLTQRVALMLASFEREAPRPEYKVQATRVVDEVMRGVT